MEKIVVRPGALGWLAMLLFIVVAIYLAFHNQLLDLHPVNGDESPNYYALFLLILPLGILATLKTVRIENETIVIRYVLTRKRIRASIDAIDYVHFATTKQHRDQSFYDRLIRIQFKDRRKTRVFTHGGMHSGVADFEVYFRTHHDQLVAG